MQNLYQRNAYDKQWNHVVRVGCSFLQKYQIDYNIKNGGKKGLDGEKEQTRSYLYGRLLAVYEKLEQDSMKKKDMNKEEKKDAELKRATNAERLWNAYTKRPARMQTILEGKLKPYQIRLKKNNYGAAKKYEILITQLMTKLSEVPNFKLDMNKELDEDFIFGYYHQKQEFYQKKEDKQVQEDQKTQDEGGNE